MGINHDAPELTEQEELELKRFYNSLKEDTRTSSYFFKPVEHIEKVPDDIKYNQKWWEGYCADNNLDIKSGKKK